MTDAYKDVFTALGQIEGGYVDDPNDHGGETFRGIARVFHPAWRGWKIIDHLKEQAEHFPDDSLNQSAALDEAVKEFYYEHFWCRLGLNKVMEVPAEQNPENKPAWETATYQNRLSLAHEIFEMAVNLGVGQTTKYLQRAFNGLNTGNLHPDLVVDGVFGPNTLRALLGFLKLRDRSYALDLTKAINAYQAVHYLEISRKDHTQRGFIQGWMKRVAWM